MYEWRGSLNNEILKDEYTDGTNYRDPQVFHTWRDEIWASFGLIVLLHVVVDLEGVVNIGPTNAQHDHYTRHKHHICISHLVLLLRTFLLLLHTVI